MYLYFLTKVALIVNVISNKATYIRLVFQYPSNSYNKKISMSGSRNGGFIVEALISHRDVPSTVVSHPLGHIMCSSFFLLRYVYKH